MALFFLRTCTSVRFDKQFSYLLVGILCRIYFLLSYCFSRSLLNTISSIYTESLYWWSLKLIVTRVFLYTRVHKILVMASHDHVASHITERDRDRESEAYALLSLKTAPTSPGAGK